MKKKMLAIYFDGNAKVTDRDVPVPNRQEALVRMQYAGICNTDLEILEGYMSFKGIPGHEFVGVVAESPWDKSLVGKRVVGEINISCGQCHFCRSGLDRHCPDRQVLGISGKDGAFAEFLTLPISNLHEVPENVSDGMAVFTEPLAAAMEILEQVDIPKESTVAVLGDGKLGILVAQVMKIKTDYVVCFGHQKNKLAILNDMGIETSLENPGWDAKYNFVVDCTGVPEGLRTALRAVRPRGTVVAKSTYHGEITLDFAQPVVHEITIVGSRCGSFPPALEALSHGEVRVEALIREVIPLSRGQEALALAGNPESLKVLLHNNT